MPKRTTPFELMLPPRTPATPAYRWLYSALRDGILEGRLRPKARLPSTRDLASHYRLSRGTVVNAFLQLRSEGYLEGTVGSGTFVSEVLPEDLLKVPRPDTRPPLVSTRKRTLSRYGRRVKAFPGVEGGPIHAFRANLPAVDLFPVKLWAQIEARRMRRVSSSLLLGCEPMGYGPLRVAIADYLGTSRGVKCVPQQVAIVSGMHEAFDLTARLFVNAGDRVCMEDPAYPGATSVLESVGAKIAALRLDDQGMTLPGSRLRGARLIYVTPAHHFPLGTTMSLGRRLELLEWADQSDALIFEDDYDGEYRYSGRPIPALQGLDRAGIVLFAGSFSKVLFPSLRLAYLVVPPDLTEYFAATLSVTRRHAPLLGQAVLSDFITEGHFGRHLRRMRQVYAERLTVLLEAARQRLVGLLEISSVEAGLQTAGWLGDGLDGESAAVGAAKRGVEVTPLTRYSRGPHRREGLQLGFAAVDTDEIRRGVRELAAALEAEARASRRRVDKEQ